MNRRGRRTPGCASWIRSRSSPRCWAAIAREQDGDLKGAEAEYRTLLAGAEEPWKGLLEFPLAGGE